MKILIILISYFLFTPTVIANPVVTEIDNHENWAQQNKAYILNQINKKFVLTTPEGETIKNPKEIKINKDDYLLIVNNEKLFVHNIYDVYDKSWIIKKQDPQTAHSIKFTEAKEHFLRCAIHPMMKVKIIVEQ